jgi:ribosomal protein S18 acetylase RimI-like enzyme
MTSAMMNAEIRIRTARPEDADWIVALAPRLHEFGPPPWREVADMNASVTAGFVRDLTDPKQPIEYFVAEDASGTPLGFVSLRTDRDYFLDVLHGHVSDIIVTEAGEGRGVGRALLEFADRWAKERGYPWLSLHVFEGNDRARRLYERMGYKVEWIRLVKPLGPIAR